MTATFNSIAKAQGWNANSILHILMRVVSKNNKHSDLDEYACKQAFDENNWNNPELEFDHAEDGGYSFSEVSTQQGWNTDSLVSVVRGFVEEANLKDALIKEAECAAKIEVSHV